MRTDRSVLHDEFAESPYWWRAAPRPVVDAPEVPRQIDVAVVGSGFTGLAAALPLARAGRDVVVFEANAAGHGASTRNAGFIGKTLKHSFSSLLDGHGENYAISVYREMQSAFDHVIGLVRDEKIDCHLTVCGRFMAANTPDHYESMARELELKRKFLGDESEMVPRTRQHTEIGSDKFHGGAVIPSLAALHPGLYQLGLLKRVKDAGVTLLDHCPVSTITPIDGGGFTVTTPRGDVRAGDVIIATNGYTGRTTSWLRRRLVPFRAFMMTTEELAPETMDRILPNSRTTHDYNNNLLYMRRTPDGNRLMLGGLTGTMTDDLPAMATRLHDRMCRVFPDLKQAQVQNMWSGYCAGSFDLYPHMGVHDGMHYALGYCFAGVPMGTYLGTKIAKRILGEPDWETVFTDRPFPTKWWYGGTPWFVPFYMAHLNRLDRLGR